MKGGEDACVLLVQLGVLRLCDACIAAYDLHAVDPSPTTFLTVLHQQLTSATGCWVWSLKSTNACSDLAIQDFSPSSPCLWTLLPLLQRSLKDLAMLWTGHPFHSFQFFRESRQHDWQCLNRSFSTRCRCLCFCICMNISLQTEALAHSMS